MSTISFRRYEKKFHQKRLVNKSKTEQIKNRTKHKVSEFSSKVGKISAWKKIAEAVCSDTLIVPTFEENSDSLFKKLKEFFRQFFNQSFLI